MLQLSIDVFELLGTEFGDVNVRWRVARTRPGDQATEHELDACAVAVDTIAAALKGHALPADQAGRLLPVDVDVQRAMIDRRRSHNGTPELVRQ